MSNATEEDKQIAAVKKDGADIRFIENPSKWVQLIAVKNDHAGLALKYIKDPSKEVQLAAVSAFGPSVCWIDDPDEDVQLAAITADSWSLNFIKNPTERAMEVYRGLQDAAMARDYSDQ